MNAHDTRMAAIRDNPPAPFGRKALPGNIEAEQALLGAILMNGAAIDAIPPELDQAHFEEQLHGQIFAEAKRLHAAGRAVNPLLIKSAVVGAPAMIGEMTFAQYLAKLASESVGAYMVPELAIAIIDQAQRRRLITLSQNLERIAFEHEIELPDEIKAIEDQLSELRADRSGDRQRTSAGDSYIKMFEGSMSRDGIVGVPIALPEIAKVLSEPVFEAGNLYGFLSSSGEGKTSLTMQIIHHAVTNGHPTLFLSYDQSAGQCVRQMIAQHLGIEVRRQRDPQKWLSRQEQDKCLDFAMLINRQPLEIIRCQREGVDKLTSYGRRFAKRFANGKTPLIVIDHIGKVKPRDPKLSPDRISGDVTVELKSFADEMSAAVLILNQRNSEGTKRDNPRPIARDLYGGEGARADYDAVLYLYRPEKYRNELYKIASTKQDFEKINRVFGEEERWKGIAELGVIKSRFGDPTITDTLKFDAQYTRYVSMRRRDQEDLL